MHPIGFLGIFILLLGAGLLIWGIMVGSRTRGEVAAARQWPEVAATVTQSGVGGGYRSASDASLALDLLAGTNTNYRNRTYTPVIRYTYEVGGRTYEGHRLRFGYLKTNNAYAARQMLVPYPVGAPIRIRYNPLRPEESVAEPVTTKNHIVAYVFGPFLIVMGLFMIVGAASGLFDNGGGRASHYRRHY